MKTNNHWLSQVIRIKIIAEIKTESQYWTAFRKNFHYAYEPWRRHLDHCVCSQSWERLFQNE